MIAMMVRKIFSPSMRLQTSHMSPTMDLDSISCLMIDPMMISRSFVQIITYLMRMVMIYYHIPKGYENCNAIVNCQRNTFERVLHNMFNMQCILYTICTICTYQRLRNSRRSLTVRFHP